MLEYLKKEELILNKIKEYKNIVVFRHENPDFDALGSQFGIKYLIEENFEDKNVYVVGQNLVNDRGNMFEKMDVLDDEFFENNEFLAIVLDCGNEARIDDKRFKKAKYSIKIDHHPVVEDFCDLNYVIESAAATCEIVPMIFANHSYSISKKAAACLFAGLVTDSGRFMFSSVSPKTFNTAALLLSTGISLQDDVYNKIYARSSDEIRLIKEIYNSYQKTPNGVGYFIISDEQEKRLNADANTFKEYVSLLSGFSDIPIWVSICEEKELNRYRVSIRSRDIVVNEVAALHHGGGHKFAAGARVFNKEEIEVLLQELDDLLK